jgi:hypothetical protein
MLMSAATMMRETELEPSPVIDLLDLLEGLPVVLRAARFARGLRTPEEAGKAIGIHPTVIRKVERGDGTQTAMPTLITIAEWLGPLTRDEWEELRWTETPPTILSRADLLHELEVAMRGGTNDVREIARRLGYDKPASLSMRLRRMGELELANFFEAERPHGSAGPDSVPIPSYVRVIMRRNVP